MSNLTTNYLGLTLSSPLIVGSSRLTSTIENLKKIEENGAGAVVLKSLFEEQITHYISTLPSASGFPEADDYISNYSRTNSVSEYLRLIQKAKKELRIPVIPSINCYSSEGWTDFARNIAEAGADALEVNMFFLPVDRKTSAYDSEKIYFELIEKLRDIVTVPVAMKIGYRFSNILYMVDQFYLLGIKGVVMFNRFYEPDIDINQMGIVPAPIFSHEGERRNVLRWIAMTSAQGLKMDISASTGVHGGDDVVRYLLAGANTVQVCSALFIKDIPFLKTLNQYVSDWMSEKKFKSIDEFRGKLNWHRYEKPAAFERTQFMKYFSSED